VAGLKPTDRLVSRAGVLPISRTMDCIGPLAWTVQDCALMLSGMISDDPDDRAIKGFEVPDISDLNAGIRGLRIGVVRHFYENDRDVEPQVLSAMNLSLSTFRRLGARLSTVQLADFQAYSTTSKNITWPEEYSEHGAELRGHPDRFGAVTRSRLQDGKNVSAPDYINAKRTQAIMIADLARVMQDIDVLVLPTMKKPAQVLGFEATAKVDLSLNRQFNLTGNPALALCNGFTTAGLPLSLQIVGRHFEDATVLRAGHALEQALDLRARRPAVASMLH
jgi:aspartyl-tRNA(Asn)/glutamyl-tRNA(Gln) amidotransferase subunit A